MKIAVKPLPFRHYILACLLTSPKQSIPKRVRLSALSYGLERFGDQDGLLCRTKLRRKKLVRRGAAAREQRLLNY